MNRISRIAATAFLIYFGLWALLLRRVNFSDFIRLIKQAREGVDPEDMEDDLQDAMYTKVLKTMEAMGDAWDLLSDWFGSLRSMSRVGVFFLGFLAFLIAVVVLTALLQRP